MTSRAADWCCDGQSVVCKYKAIDNLWDVVILEWDWRWLQEEETKNKRVWRLRVLGFSSCVVWIVLGLLQLFGGTWVELIWNEMCQTIIHLYFPWLSHIVYDLWGTFHMPLHVCMTPTITTLANAV
jgi:hypothetical protein